MVPIYLGIRLRESKYRIVMKVSSSCQWSHSSSWVGMVRMVRMVRMVDQSLLLLFLPLLSSAGPFHPFLHGLFGFRDSEAGSTSTFTSMPITAPAAIELCPRKRIDFKEGEVTAYTGSSGGHCGFAQLPQGVGDKYVAISHLGWMEGHFCGACVRFKYTDGKVG